METIKLKGDYKLWTVTQTQFAQIVGMTQPRINQMLEDSILFRDESSKNGALFLIDSLRSFYSIKTGGKGEDKVDDAAVDFWRERALNEKAKRELNELKLCKERGELYEAAIVEDAVFEILTNFKNKLSGIPAKLSPQLEGKNVAQINRLLTDEIYDNLQELANDLENANFTAEVDEEPVAEN